MLDFNISAILKQLRKTSGISANGVVEKLKEYKIDISSKTLYGYESGLSMPNADVFVSLCKIYKCDNPMEFMNGNSYQPYEIDLLEKYRDLDDHGRDMVDMVLDKETERIEKYGKLTDDSRIITLLEVQSHRDPSLVLPYWENGVSAGNGIYQLNDTENIMLTLWATNLTRQADFIIKVSGSSMEPDYHDGDRVLVDRKASVLIGEVGIFVKNGDTFIKELGEGELISRNPEHQNIPVHDFDNVVCLGKVIGTLKDEMIVKE